MLCTYHIQIVSRETVLVKRYDDAHQLIGEASGSFISEHLPKIGELHEKARQAKSGEAIEADEIGRLLFNSLLDDKLRSNFLNCYQNIKDNNSLRIELEADERKRSDIVSLPWEFLCKPADEHDGIIRFASNPKMIFSRWRAQGNIPKPISLKAGEDLRIVLAVADPSDFKVRVKYEEVLNTIKKLAQTERIGLSEFVNFATRKTIDEALKKYKPHIFHFIGHGDMKDGGQIALVNDFGTAEWIKSDKFGELFNRHQPGVVLLQSCESGALSASDAYTGIASRVVQQQIPAVIAMQYEVSNATACDFASEFYRWLSKGSPADLAAQEARRHIELQSSGNTRDFATPVLFMRVWKGEVFQREIPNPSEIPGLIEQIRQHEQKSAYDQAIKKWRMIQQIDSHYPDAVPKIERLTKLIEQNATFNKINHELLRRMRDILPIYKPLAAYVKRMAKEETSEDGEIFLNVMNQFLENNISGQEFIEIWKQFETRPSSTLNIPNYDILAKRLIRGEIIPVLGTEALRLSQIAQKMAEKIRYDDFAGTLSMISQYYQYEGHSRGMLIETVKALMDQEDFACIFDPIYNLLKRIEKPFILISSSYDSLWECIFHDNGKKYAVLSPSNQEIAKIVLKYHDKDQEYKTPEEISELRLLENGFSMIYKICGGFGLDSGDDALMISETDFFTVSKRLEKLIPEYLIRQFSGKSFLFLGYDLEQWHDRLIAHSILEKANRRDRSFAVRENPTPYQRAFWKSNNVDIYDVELQEFIGNFTRK